MLRPNIKRPSRENAEELAIQALLFLSEDEDRLNSFLTETGLSPDNLRSEAQNPDFLEAVMDFITSAGDEMIVQFSQQARCRPEDVLAAALMLKRHQTFD